MLIYSLYLGYLYSTGLTKNEESQVNEKVQKNQRDFKKGLRGGTTLYSFYVLTIASAQLTTVPLKLCLPSELRSLELLSDSRSRSSAALVMGVLAIYCSAIASFTDLVSEESESERGNDFVNYFLGFTCGAMLIPVRILVVGI